MLKYVLKYSLFHHLIAFFLSCSNIALIGSLGATSVSIGLFLYLSHYEMSETSQPGNNGPGQIISSVRSIRLAIFIITTSLIAACAVFNVITFDETVKLIRVDDVLVDNDENSTNYINFTLTSIATIIDSEPPALDSTIPPIYLFLCGLSLSSISAFLHTGFILKFFMMLITVALQTLILYTSQTFEDYETYGQYNM